MDNSDPTRILDLILRRRSGTAAERPNRSGAGPIHVDPIGAATIAADLALTALLQPQRAARLIDHHGRNEASPGFDEVVAAVIRATWNGPRPADGYGRSIQQALQNLVIARLMDVAASGDASPQVRAEATYGLRRIRFIANTSATAHSLHARDEIERFLNRPERTPQAHRAAAGACG